MPSKLIYYLLAFLISIVKYICVSQALKCNFRNIFRSEYRNRIKHLYKMKIIQNSERWKRPTLAFLDGDATTLVVVLVTVRTWGVADLEAVTVVSVTVFPPLVEELICLTTRVVVWLTVRASIFATRDSTGCMRVVVTVRDSDGCTRVVVWLTVRVSDGCTRVDTTRLRITARSLLLLPEDMTLLAVYEIRNWIETPDRSDSRKPGRPTENRSGHFTYGPHKNKLPQLVGRLGPYSTNSEM